ncbi:MAG: ribosome biogenesis GTPase YlqF [Clostridia bacterium]|nr:ribosome biogenesis GTPase YlqF [Clostridia bacterium]
MDIHWYPGHMTKARREMEQCMKDVDCVLEIVDARCPESSRNPDLPSISKGKKTLIVINKADIADADETQRWQAKFKREGLPSVTVSSVNGKGIEKITGAIRELMREKTERDKARGLVNRPIRAMVCGIPNVGKSSFINKLCRKGAAKVGDRPGVTRGRQWISLEGGIELLDTPGILWPKFEDKRVALNLAFIGSIKDDVLDTEELGASLLKKLAQNCPELLEERYKIEITDCDGGAEVLEKICRKRGFLLKGNECDYLRGSSVVLDEFRGAKIGKITLETANVEKEA